MKIKINVKAKDDVASATKKTMCNIELSLGIVTIKNNKIDAINEFCIAKAQREVPDKEAKNFIKRKGYEVYEEGIGFMNLVELSKALAEEAQTINIKATKFTDGYGHTIGLALKTVDERTPNIALFMKDIGAEGYFLTMKCEPIENKEAPKPIKTKAVIVLEMYDGRTEEVTLHEICNFSTLPEDLIKPICLIPELDSLICKYKKDFLKPLSMLTSDGESPINPMLIVRDANHKHKLTIDLLSVKNIQFVLKPLD